MECKWKGLIKQWKSVIELIDTLWNVNRKEQCRPHDGG